MKHSIQLHIDKPCRENWDSMEGSGLKRHCKTCETQVTDFSSMSDEQLYRWIKNSNGKSCGRLREDQLNRVISESHSPKKSLLISRIFAAVSLFFTQILHGNPNQVEIPVKSNISLQSDYLQDTVTKTAIKPRKNQIRIKGSVYDNVDGRGLDSVSIRIGKTATKYYSNAFGEFEITFDSITLTDTVELIFRKKNFESKTMILFKDSLPLFIDCKMNRLEAKRTVIMGAAVTSSVNRSSNYTNFRLIQWFDPSTIFSGR